MKHTINAKNLSYKQLNRKIKEVISGSATNNNNFSLDLKDVLGHRYIGDGLKTKVKINVYGTPGNDLAAFMDGPDIEIYGNGQDAVGNTMNSGRIVIHGDAGDIIGYSIRGGEIYIENDAGYRCGIHMKSYRDKVPAIIIGGTAGNFLGEYMAGGIIIVMGISDGRNSHQNLLGHRDVVGNYVGTGMHGGIIYVRGEIRDYKLGKEVKKMPINKEDIKILNKYIANYNKFFEKKANINSRDFIKLIPYSHRPYGKLYAY
ncbi:MAG: hypothetical protein ACQEP2_07015 [Actinomycetota bacterium]